MNERRQVRLVIVGGIVQHPSSRDYAVCQSYEEQIKALAVELGVAERVVWTGHCPSTEDQGSIYLRSADVCVLPFDHGVYLNNSSFSAAVTHGLAVVTTKGDKVEGPIVHERNVFLCPPKDPVAMATALIMLIDNPTLRRRLQEGARDLAREWFSWDTVIQRISASFMRESKVAALG
jgi:rhamnosyl/mannosyltransferase